MHDSAQHKPQTSAKEAVQDKESAPGAERKTTAAKVQTKTHRRAAEPSHQVPAAIAAITPPVQDKHAPPPLLTPLEEAAVTPVSVTEVADTSQAFSDCQGPVSVNYQVALTDPDAFLISQLTLGQDTLSNEFFIYPHKGKRYLPLQALAEQLLLPLQVDIASQSAEGWYLSSDRRISLSNQSLSFFPIQGECQFGEALVLADDWDLYLDEDLMKAIFGLELSFNPSRQQLKIAPNDRLPLSQLKARKARIDKLNNQKKAQNNIKAAPIANRYAMLGDLATQLDVGVRTQKRDDESTTEGDLFIQARGDLLHHSVYAGYSQTKNAGQFNFYAERYFKDSWLKHYRFGEVDAHNQPLVAQNAFGEGLIMSAGDMLSEDLRYITVEGEQAPDWDVELYRNNSLVAVQRIGNDGRYRFTDVPVFFGLNQYQLRFYGPSGEQRSESFSKLLDPSVLKPGSLGFQAGSLSRSQDDLRQHWLDATLALGSQLTTTLGVVQQESQPGQWQTFPRLSTHLLFDTSLWQLDLASSGNGTAISLAAQGAQGSLDWQGQWDKFDNFHSWDNPDGRIRERARLGLSSQLAGTGLQLGVRGDWQKLNLGSDLISLTAQASGGIGSLSANNELTWQDTGGFQRWYNRFALSGRLDDWYLRSYLDVDLVPDLDINQWVTNASTQVSGDTHYSVELKFQPQTDSKLSMRHTLATALDYGTVRLALENNDMGDWLMQLNWNSSALWMPRRGEWLQDGGNFLSTGAVRLKAFIDDNNNGLLDEGEQPLAGLRFSGHRNSGAKTDDTGELLLTQLNTSKGQRLVLDERSLGDPFLQAKYRAISVETHPGHVQEVMFPVLMTAEAEGSLHYVDGRAAKGVEVLLESRDGNARYKSYVEYDGIFLFERLLPGEYRLTIDGISMLDLQPFASGEFMTLGNFVIPYADSNRE